LLADSQILILVLLYVNYLNLSSLNILTRSQRDQNEKKIRAKRILAIAQQFMMETLVATLTRWRFQLCCVNLLLPFASRFWGQEIWFAALQTPNQTILIVAASYWFWPLSIRIYCSILQEI